MTGSENNKSGAKCAAKADSHPGTSKKAIDMSKEDISEKKNKVVRPFKKSLFCKRLLYIAGRGGDRA